jgi:hypothetical protein
VRIGQKMDFRLKQKTALGAVCTASKDPVAYDKCSVCGEENAVRQLDQPTPIRSDVGIGAIWLD